MDAIPLALALEAAARASVALLIAAVAARLLRRSSAAARHAAWMAGLAGSIAVPGLMWAAPAWPISVAAPLPSPVAFPSGNDSVEPAGRPEALGPIGALAPAPRTVGPAVAEPPILAALATPAPGAIGAPASRRSWLAFAPLAWLGGVLAVLARIAAGRARLRRLSRRSSPLPAGPRSALAEELARTLCPGRWVVLARSAEDHSPMTWGTWRPVVLLPAASDDWPEDLFRSVVAHELGHVRRLDSLSQGVARLACAVHWFNPLAWLAAGRLRVEREIACDDLVLSLGGRPSDYASHLLAIARHLRAPSPALAMARPSRLEGRLRALLDPSRDHRPLRRRSMLTIGGLGLLLALPVAGARTVLVAQEPGPALDSSSTTVTGLVLDPEGRPVSNARVAAIGYNVALDPARHEVLDQAVTGPDGAFRLEWPMADPLRHSSLHIAANAEGFSLGWVRPTPGAIPPSVEVRLGPAGHIDGRVVFEEEPIAGAEVWVESLNSPLEHRWNDRFGLGLARGEAVLDQLVGLWPTGVTSGPDGRFQLSGIAPDATVRLRIDATDFVPQSFRLNPGRRDETISLRPSVEVFGQITRADTGEPVEGASVVVKALESPGLHDVQRTGPDGRYRARGTNGERIEVSAIPPTGAPYLALIKTVDGDPDDERHEIDLALPRGVLLTGRVIERETGRPVQGARVWRERPGAFRANGGLVSIHDAHTDAEGRYRLVVPAGPGHLVVLSPNEDHAREALYYGFLKRTWPDYDLGLADDPARITIGRRYYAHAFHPHDARPGEASREIDLSVRRGATLSGRVVGPDGRPIQSAEIVATRSVPSRENEWRGEVKVPVRDGRFELRGLPPGEPVRCYFLDAENRLGAMVDLSDTVAADGPVVVRLRPCVQARGRLVDVEGKPFWYGSLKLGLIAAPGSSRRPGANAKAGVPGGLAADEASSEVVDPLHYGGVLWPDDEGRFVLPALIPGAIYRVYVPGSTVGDSLDWRNFTVEPGQDLDLGEFTIPPPGWGR